MSCELLKNVENWESDFSALGHEAPAKQFRSE